MNDNDARQSILQATYAMVGSETTFKYRSLALTMLQRTWDLVPSDMAARALTDLLQQMIDRPSPVPGRSELDRDSFGPAILELMAVLDMQRAAAIAREHPDWDAARRIPGRTPGNPVNGPGSLLRPAKPPPPPPPRPKTILTPMTGAEFDQAVANAHGLTPATAKVERLIALGFLLLTEPSAGDPAAGTVRGRVLWNEQPGPGAKVYAASEYNFNSTRYGSAMTETLGRFSISGVPAGTKYLYVFGNQRAEGWPSGRWRWS